MKENRLKLCSIVDTIITCGKQGISLRGHRDDRKDDESNPHANHGNFLELLKFRARGGDEVLEKHLQNSDRNARYTSKTIQNELITICGDMIRNCILNDVRQAKFYSIIADEASDSANIEQLAISIRYVDNTCNPQERLLGFIECISGVTGKAIAENIISNLGCWKLELANMRGQSYDGAGAMSGTTKGVAARILEQCPKAQYTHCAAHRLNLCVVKCCSIREVSNAMDCADSVVRFFSNSPKRQLFFEKCVDSERDANHQFEQRTKLKELCRTRWVERHDAFEVFVHLFKPLITCLETIALSPAGDWNRQTRQDANSLLHSLSRFPMLVALMLTREVLLLTKGLSIKLQGTYVDIVRAHNEVNLVKKHVEENRKKVVEFHQRSTAALTGGATVGISEDMPRILQGRQQHRANPGASTVPNVRSPLEPTK